MSVPTKPASNAPTSEKVDSTPTTSSPSKPTDPRQQFMMAALSMSWQLAIVVLVPLLGGFRLDKHFDSLPLWTAVGFVAGLAGGAVVVWKHFKQFSPKITQSDIENAKKLRDQEENDD